MGFNNQIRRDMTATSILLPNEGGSILSMKRSIWRRRRKEVNPVPCGTGAETSSSGKVLPQTGSGSPHGTAAYKRDREIFFSLVSVAPCRQLSVDCGSVVGRARCKSGQSKPLQIRLHSHHAKVFFLCTHTFLHPGKQLLPQLKDTFQA